MDTQQRIENFRKMAQDDPQNELGHFSLGKAYLDAGQSEEAVSCFEQVLALKGDFSKAFQHLAEAQHALGRTDEAVSTLTRGFKVAAERGDVMPREAMARMLRELGHEPPQAPAPPRRAEAPVTEGSVRCCRCGRVGQKLETAPIKSDLGRKIAEHVCKDCWREWIGMGTKVINELRLDFSNPQAAEQYDTHLREFLQLPA